MSDIYIYHYSGAKQDKVAPIALAADIDTSSVDAVKQKIGDYRFQTYQHEVFGVLSFISPEHIMKLQDNGFKQWSMHGTICHKINLTKQAKKIIYIQLLSLPEQTEYMNDNWDTFYHRFSHKDEDLFGIGKDVLNEEMAAATGIATRMSFASYEKILKKHKHWLDIDRWIDFNIENGSKQQYASYIPHIGVYVTSPLTVEEYIYMEKGE